MGVLAPLGGCSSLGAGALAIALDPAVESAHATVVDPSADTDFETGPSRPRPFWLLPWYGLVWLVRTVLSGLEWCFGLLALVAGLALLAAVPVLQFLSFGYLLEVSGRIARTGRLSEGLIGVRRAARVGSVVLGTWLFLLPLRYLATFERDARLIDPTSPATQWWTTFMTVITVIVALHIVGAWARGGRLRHFLLPIINPLRVFRAVFRRGAYRDARDAVWEFVAALRLPYYFWLGLRGFVGGLLWLLVPVTMLATGRDAPVIGVLGALLMVLVALYLPLLQTHFAAQGRLRNMLALRAIRESFARAPLAWFLALFGTLALALPLYVLKIEMIPREVAWLPSLVFVLFMLPARFLCGWAYARGNRREDASWRLVRWPLKVTLIPVAVIYVGFVYLTQFAAWDGIWSLYEQHAFLLPVPFNEM